MTITILDPLAIDIRGLVRGTVEEFAIALETDQGAPADTTGLTATAKAQPIQPAGGDVIDLVADFVGSNLVVTMGESATELFGVLNAFQVEITGGPGPRVVGEGTIQTKPKLW